MIKLIINRLTFIKKLPINFAKKIIGALIVFDHFFWKIRILLFSIIMSKNSRVKKILNDLAKNGYAVYENYYDSKETEAIKQECEKTLNFLPLDQVAPQQNIPNLMLKNGVTVEKLDGSLKIKRLGLIDNYFKEIAKKIEIRLIYLIYQISWHPPLLIYNLVHDGSYKHPAMPQAAGKKMIAGQPHIDSAIHSLRCALALEKVKSDNGPTVVFEKSMYFNKIKEAHLNLLLNNFNFDTGDKSAHNINQEDLKLLENSSKRIELTCNKGDLLLVDLKNLHYQKILDKGQRHLIWYYN